MAAEGVQYSDAVAWLLRGTASSDASRGRLDSMAIDALFDSVDTRLGGQPSSQPQQAAPAPPEPPAEEPQPPLPWRILQLEVHEGQQRRDATGASYTAHHVRTLIEVVSRSWRIFPIPFWRQSRGACPGTWSVPAAHALVEIGTGTRGC